MLVLPAGPGTWGSHEPGSSSLQRRGLLPSLQTRERARRCRAGPESAFDSSSTPTIDWCCMSGHTKPCEEVAGRWQDPRQGTRLGERGRQGPGSRRRQGSVGRDWPSAMASRTTCSTGSLLRAGSRRRKDRSTVLHPHGSHRADSPLPCLPSAPSILLKRGTHGSLLCPLKFLCMTSFLLTRTGR